MRERYRETEKDITTQILLTFSLYYFAFQWQPEIMAPTICTDKDYRVRGRVQRESNINSYGECEYNLRNQKNPQ